MMRTLRAIGSIWLSLLVPAVLLSQQSVAETQTRGLSGFDRVSFALPGELLVEQGDRHVVVLEASPEDLERITTEVSGDILTVGWEEGLLGWWDGPDGDITVRVTLPLLSGLEAAGSGTVVAGSWQAASLRLTVRGSGGMRFAELATGDLTLEVAGSGSLAIGRLDADSARIEIRGSGDVRLAGSAAELNIDVMGSGDVDAGELQADRVAVAVQGSGNVSVWAENRLSVEVMGSGDVVYRGSPEVEQTRRGSGSIRSL